MRLIGSNEDGCSCTNSYKKRKTQQNHTYEFSILMYSAHHPNSKLRESLRDILNFFIFDEETNLKKKVKCLIQQRT